MLGIVHSASIARLQHDESPRHGADSQVGGGIEREAWIKAIVHGADDKSPRWRHLLVLAGLLLGFEGQGREALSWSLKRDLEAGLVTATNLALEELRGREGLSALTVALVLNHTFPLLSESERQKINYDVRSTSTTTQDPYTNISIRLFYPS